MTLKTRLALFLLFASSCLNSALAREEVFVGVTHFPPFYNITGQTHVDGLGMDVMQALNSVQDQYVFKPVPASPRRRHQMFKEGKYDMSFFDHLAWGWDENMVDATDIYLKGGEVFITQNTGMRDQSFFDHLNDKSIAAINGYHYKFADYVTDPNTLKQRFNIQLVQTQAQILKLVSTGRIEIGIMTETYLLQYFKKHPELRDKILASRTYDQHYRFRTIVRKSISPDAKQMDQWMKIIRAAPQFDWIKEKYGISW